ncbi:hypothetical protein ZEAMMB73_Zm00001d036530 [Zea mays]|nr:hypothetical protein ZEAMMB73_Zm00001d036530 [Zea mays]AQK81261.1 hypothetical protein ZEAMMB73_Zm00001d036530 [Zea mays]
MVQAGGSGHRRGTRSSLCSSEKMRDRGRRRWRARGRNRLVRARGWIRSLSPRDMPVRSSLVGSCFMKWMQLERRTSGPTSRGGSPWATGPARPRCRSSRTTPSPPTPLSDNSSPPGSPAWFLHFVFLSVNHVFPYYCRWV